MSTICWICEKKKPKTKFRPIQLVKVKSRVCKDCEKKIDQELEREKMPLKNVRLVDRGERKIRKRRTVVKERKKPGFPPRPKLRIDEPIVPLTFQWFL